MNDSNIKSKKSKPENPKNEENKSSNLTKSNSEPIYNQNQKKKNQNNNSVNEDINSDNKNYNQNHLNKNKNPDIEKKQSKETKIENTPVTKILGQIHNTYIIVEAYEGMYIIDQHAAHERIFYERFYNKFNNDQIISQPLLVPIQLELTLSEIELIKKYKNKLKNLGIILENFGGNSFLIQEVPSIIKKRSSKEVVKEIIDNILNKGEALERAELIDEIITYMSCRTAVKAGDKLENIEIKKMIKELFSTSNPYRCPHGRPAFINLDKNDLEKGLGRK